MKLEHSFSVPVPPERAWHVLLDVQKIAPCMPGASIGEVEGDEFTGTVKVKVGPITVTYGGRAKWLEKDAVAHRAVLEAKGKETRGSGTASATVTGTLTAEGEGTRVHVVTDLAITGKPAQFGRGVMADVGAKLIGQFATCLADELGADVEPEVEAVPAPAEEAGVSTAENPVVPAPPLDAGAAGVPADAPSARASDAGAPSAGASDASAPTLRADEAGSPPVGASTIGSPGEGIWPAPAAPRTSRPTPEAIDLLDAAGGAVGKRLAPVIALIAVVIAVLLLRRRRNTDCY